MQNNGPRVVEEIVDESYEPTQSEVNEYAEWLGMDLEQDTDLFWIARAGLKAPLPPPWRPCQTGTDEVFYFNFETGESVWDHPADDHYRKVYLLEKEKVKKVLATLHASVLESGSVHVCVTSMGGNELASVEMQHTEHSFQWLERRLDKSAGTPLQLVLPDGQALGEADRKKPLCEILGIAHAEKKEKKRKKGQLRAPTELPPLKGSSLVKAKTSARSPLIRRCKASPVEPATNGTLLQGYTTTVNRDTSKNGTMHEQWLRKSSEDECCGLQLTTSVCSGAVGWVYPQTIMA